ncbi:phosphate ABC transporter substrate-binding/OmpA family protein [Kangiella japonica]|uniref:Phosphate ABC transporter substrate-binding/OmpA family protein n=1 Tax=Kangiella japonica TaxID=647384 RepID=A0ABP3CM01_9GAMM
MPSFLFSRVIAACLLCFCLPPLSANEKNSDTNNKALAESEVLFTLSGSNTIGEKLAPALARSFLEKLGASNVEIFKTHAVEKTVVGVMPDGKNQAIEIKAHGSSTGFKALADKKTDIAMASRRIKDKERKSLLAEHGDLSSVESEYTIAVDGLAVIVHPEITIKQLNTEQLAHIFSGKITNWNELGGNDKPIKLFARDEQSGTYDTFKSLVLKRHKVALSPQAKRFESSGKLSKLVSTTQGAIGFVALPYVNAAKPIAVAEAGASLYFSPTKFTVSTEDYALSRRLYLYLPANSTNPYAQQFIDFVLKDEAQKVVEESNLVSLMINDATVRFNRNYPPRYLNMIRESKRLSVTFHFDHNLQLDNKGQRDIGRLVDYIKQNAISDVFVFGFSAESLDTSHDKSLSKELANTISAKLEKLGVKPFYTQGYGSRGAIASNDTENGRAKNQRVEIWVGR